MNLFKSNFVIASGILFQYFAPITCIDFKPPVLLHLGKNTFTVDYSLISYHDYAAVLLVENMFCTQ